jgi:hypothetical protein
VTDEVREARTMTRPSVVALAGLALAVLSLNRAVVRGQSPQSVGPAHSLYKAIRPAPPGFFPKDWRAAAFAPGSQTHESITTDAFIGLNGLVQELFPDALITDAVRQAVQEIVDADADVDNDQTPNLHFDAETFYPSQDRIKALANATIQRLVAGNPKDARLLLGAALHTVQDFYSHTNWVELGGSLPAPQLVSPFPPFLPQTLANGDPTCDQLEPDPDTRAFTSGYYSGSGPARYPGKCIHGGLVDFLPGLGINKDSVNPNFSPHALRHQEAAQLAELSTADFVRGIIDRLVQIDGSSDLALGRIASLFRIDQLSVQNTNQTSPIELWIYAGSELLDAQLLPQETNTFALPDLLGCLTCSTSGGSTPFEITVRGVSSASITGLAGYDLKLPPTLEFVEVRSDRGTTTALSGQEHVDLLVLNPISGPAHRVNTYRVRLK